MKKNRRQATRLCDAIALRVSSKQRAFLEKIAKDQNVGMCEAGRMIIDEAMRARKIC